MPSDYMKKWRETQLAKLSAAVTPVITTTKVLTSNLDQLDPQRTGGLDIDFYAGSFNPQISYLAGANFVFVRAGQNVWLDAQFPNSWVTSKSIIPRGAYWYLDKWVSNDGQARRFAGLFPNNTYDGELPIVMDMEQDIWIATGGRRSKKVHLDFTDMEAFLSALKGYLNGWDGSYIIYTGWNWWTHFGSPDPKYASVPLWMSNPPPYWTPDRQFNPPLPAPFTKYTFIQTSFAGDGLKYGVQSKGVDLDYYNGSLDQLKAQFTKGA